MVGQSRIQVTITVLYPSGAVQFVLPRDFLGGQAFPKLSFHPLKKLMHKMLTVFDTEHSKDVEPQSTDGEEDPSFVPPQSEHRNDRPVATWEQMDKASQARLTAFYEVHEMERGDKDDVKLWKDISNIILNGKHSGSIKCKRAELNFSCCRVRETETGDMCQALVVAKSSSKMWKQGRGVQCRRCQSQIGYTVYKERQKEKHGFVKKKYNRKNY